MTTILQNVDLAPNNQGWETCAANAFDSVLFTGNWFAAYSVDSGQTFVAISPKDMTRKVGLGFCCDQVVIFVPRINSYVWFLLSQKKTLLMAVASPQDLRDSKGRNWTLYHLTPGLLGLDAETFDHPDISFGDNFLYLTVNRAKDNRLIGAVIARLPLSQIQERVTVNFQFVSINDQFFIRPAQLTGDQGWFGALSNTSQLRVFSWPERPSAPVSSFNVKIDTIPDQNWTSLTPDLDDWLGSSTGQTTKIGVKMTGAARAGQQLWLCWPGARRVADKEEDTFKHPHIGIAVINLQGRRLAEQRYLWNPDHAYSWPSLAANPFDEVAISFAWGGGRFYPQHGVGTLTGKTHLIATTSGRSVGSGGHYVKVRMAFPFVNQFVAGGYNGIKDPKDPVTSVNHPHYVVFRS
jgi:hypothetical protein